MLQVGARHEHERLVDDLAAVGGQRYAEHRPVECHDPEL